MNGDNQLHLGVICRHSVQEADVWFGLYVWEMCTGLWIGSAYLPGLWAARHAMPSPWEQVQGLLLRSGADFEARRWSMNGADLRALWVFGEWSTSAATVAQDPGGDF